MVPRGVGVVPPRLRVSVLSLLLRLGGCVCPPSVSHSWTSFRKPQRHTRLKPLGPTRPWLRNSRLKSTLARLSLGRQTGCASRPPRKIFDDVRRLVPPRPPRGPQVTSHRAPVQSRSLYVRRDGWPGVTVGILFSGTKTEKRLWTRKIILCCRD